MSVLRSIEQKIEGLFEGVFGRAFRTNVQPVELARKLTKEMDDHRMASVSRTYAPNEFTLYLSTGDRSQFADYEESLVLELQDFLAEHARREGYVLLAPPTVTIDTDSDLPLGHFGIATRMVQPQRTGERPRRGAEPVLPPPIPELQGDSDAFADDLPHVPDAPPLDLGVLKGAAGAAAGAAAAAPGPVPPTPEVSELSLPDVVKAALAAEEAAPAAPAAPPAPAVPPRQAPAETVIYTPPAAAAPPEPPAPAAPETVAVLTGDAGRHVLDKPVLVMGRSRECDIVVADLNVSRRHAEVVLEGGAHWLVDLDSTNGTLVNGKRVKRVKLEAGDKITVGSTELVFERTER